MSKALQSPIPKVEVTGTAKPDEFKTNVFVKSGWPKTPKEIAQMVLSTFFNFFA